jgi:ATP/maltotriose-dependent transcriptional regulator MalT
MARTAERTTRTRGCHLVVAAAGYGKTTALHAAGATILHAASDLITQVLDVGHLAVDAVCGLSVRDQVRLFRTLATVPDDVQISVAGRRPLGAAAFAALPAPITERGPADLALPPDVVAALLRDEYGVADPDLARRVHDLTAGWPALVRLAGDVLAHHETGPGDLLPALTEPGTAAATWIRQHVLPGMPPQVAQLLEVAGDLGAVSASLCAAIAANPERATDPVRWLAGTGLLVAGAQRGRPREEPTFRFVPVVAAVLRRQRPPAGTISGRLETAATWYLRTDNRWPRSGRSAPPAGRRSAPRSSSPAATRSSRPAARPNWPASSRLCRPASRPPACG